MRHESKIRPRGKGRRRDLIDALVSTIMVAKPGTQFVLDCGSVESAKGIFNECVQRVPWLLDVAVRAPCTPIIGFSKKGGAGAHAADGVTADSETDQAPPFPTTED